MREILFRGKRKDNGDLVEGYLVKLGKESFSDPERYGICNTAIPLLESGTCYNLKIDEVIPETVGQYTGLKDKNGKRIFEGDIFECYADYDDSLGYTQTSSFLAVVVWDEKHFCWGMKVNDEIQDFSDWTWENSFLVGNIHDNPELLKGE